ncbi:MAG TPA: acyl-CoA desaturase [Thermoleophilaceae bacterium]|nr:acyl-CoA desaturase [Thermoleophilaceae bacterium]
MTTAEAAPPEIQSPLKRLTPEQIEQLGEEFQKIHDEVFDSLGDRDAKYIRSIIDLQRKLALIGRVELFGARYWPTWILGTATLSMAKILENMEIGHNVMHGQWDWMNDPQIHSSTWDWDTASTKEAWKHSHNYIHHTYTNIRGKDKDLGYEIMRIDPHQKWHPVYLLQPFYNLALMFLFEWGVALHDLDFDAIRAGEKSQKQVMHELKGIAGKARLQITKDYIAWPLVSALVVGGVHWLIGPTLARRGESKRDKAKRVSLKLFDKARRREASEARLTFALDAAKQSYKATVWANVTANIIRNLWAHSIIFCGHFPDQTYTFSQAEVEDESKGAWYVRQLIGAANIDGSPLFHVISGNLGYQVEHHLYPDMPSTRYGEIAPRVREICERYELPYNTGPFSKQLGMVHRTIIRLAFPGGKPRPKPGPYKGGLRRPGEAGARVEAAAANNGSGG